MKAKRWQKLTFFSIAFGVFTVMKWNNVLVDEAYVSLFWGCALGFSGGNVLEHFAAAMKGKNNVQ